MAAHTGCCSQCCRSLVVNLASVLYEHTSLKPQMLTMPIQGAANLRLFLQLSQQLLGISNLNFTY